MIQARAARSQAETYLKTDRDILPLLEDETQATCPVCKRALDDRMIAQLKTEVTARIEQTETELTTQIHTLDSLQHQETTKKSEKTTLLATYEDVSTMLDALKALAAEKNQGETQWQDANNAFEAAGGASQNSTLTQESKDIQNKISSLNQQLGALTAGNRTKSEIQQDLEAAQRHEFLAQLFDTTLKETMQSSRAEATEAIKDQAADLWKTILGRTEIVTVNWDSKQMVPFLEIDGESYAVGQLSASEKIALFLAIRLALAKRLGQTRFLILDEPYVQLDLENRTRLSHQLQAITPEFQILATSFQKEDAKLTGWPIKELD